MKYIISRFNHDMEPIIPYIGDDYVLYDRSEEPLQNAVVVPNIGSDIYDKLTYLIDNYNNLPEVMCLIKANLFKYISKEEFEAVKDNTKFTPLLTKNHRTYSDTNGEVCFYKDGMYFERNDYWYLREHPTKTINNANDLKKILNLTGKDYICFAPGSNYIVTRADVLKHPKDFYEKLRSYLGWAVYPGEAQLIERGLYNLWS